MTPMWNQLIPILLPVLIVKSAHVNKTDDSNVFIVSAGHAEAEDRYSKQNVVVTSAPSVELVHVVTKSPATPPAIITKEEFEYVTEKVVFIPNSNGDDRVSDGDEESLKLGEVMNYRSVDDVMNKKYEKETEPPTDNVYFVTGKNNDAIENDETKSPSRRTNDEREKKPKKKEVTLNCKDLDCNKTVQSVCGGKLDNSNWKYRIFTNECYFRKVNCQFKYDYNRYKEVAPEKCRDLGMRFIDSYYSANARHSIPVQKKEEEKPVAIPSARRSMSFDPNGKSCSHQCPTRCTEDYDPQCAMSVTGQRRMFLNHCKMDYNSCFFGVVWHKRPLAECVGGKKADLQQNRSFIGWMQRVGIVDNKGRLVSD